MENQVSPEQAKIDNEVKGEKNPTQLLAVWYKHQDEIVSDLSRAMFSPKLRPSGFLGF